MVAIITDLMVWSMGLRLNLCNQRISIGLRLYVDENISMTNEVEFLRLVMKEYYADRNIDLSYMLNTHRHIFYNSAGPVLTNYLAS